MATIEGWKQANGVKSGKSVELTDDELTELGIEGFV